MGVRGAAVKHIRMSERDMLHTKRFVPVRRFGVLNLLLSQMSIILILPDDCDDNDDVANSPNDGDNAIEDEEGSLNTGEED